MISNEVVLNKMLKELQAALQKSDNDAAVLEHITNIRLLTDLFLDDKHKPEDFQREITASTATSNQISQQAVSPEKDGTSIFDF